MLRDMTDYRDELRAEEHRTSMQLESEYEKKRMDNASEMQKMFNNKQESIKARYANAMRAKMLVLPSHHSRI